MKKILITFLFAATTATITDAGAAQHHGGHGGKSRSAVGGNCMRPRFDKFSPANMATVAPGSAFSFIAFNIDSPDQLEVTAKKLPVAIKVEFKDPSYIITGTLPDGLRDTVARINIKLNAKTNACEAEAGWLVKISE